jgi:hypothetical protein
MLMKLTVGERNMKIICLLLLVTIASAAPNDFEKWRGKHSKIERFLRHSSENHTGQSFQEKSMS